MHTLQAGSWRELSEAARAVRTAVFIVEQGIPEAEEWDADDGDATHVVVFDPAGLPVATGRLIHIGQARGHAKIGRMAVMRPSRGAGLGAQVLLALLDQARSQHIREISLHAQLTAQAFYARYGFQAKGPVFDEVDIPHQGMTLTL